MNNGKAHKKDHKAVAEVTTLALGRVVKQIPAHYWNNSGWLDNMIEEPGRLDNVISAAFEPLKSYNEGRLYELEAIIFPTIMLQSVWSREILGAFLSAPPVQVILKEAFRETMKRYLSSRIPVKSMPRRICWARFLKDSLGGLEPLMFDQPYHYYLSAEYFIQLALNNSQTIVSREGLRNYGYVRISPHQQDEIISTIWAGDGTLIFDAHGPDIDCQFKSGEHVVFGAE